jgi:F-type H+-transporting ATPase subunit delta
MNAPEVVRRYAVTLLESAEDSDILDAIRSDVDRILNVIDSSSELRAFLANPLLSIEVKERTLVALFEGKVEQLTRNFLALTARRSRTRILRDVLSSFVAMVEERRGVMSAKVVSAVELDATQHDQLKSHLSSYFGKEISIHAEVDTSLTGGIIARVGDIVFDGSLNTHLERLRRRLVGV